MYDWEHGIALHAMQWNRASSPGEGGVSWVFSIAAGTWGIFSSYGGAAIRNSTLFSDMTTPL